MDWGVVLRNIDRAIAAAKRSDHDVSAKAGRPDAIRNLKRRHTEGKGGWNHSVFSDIAKQLGYSTEELQRKDFEPRGDDADGDGFDLLRRFLMEQRQLIDKQLASLPKRRR